MLIVVMGGNDAVARCEYMLMEHAECSWTACETRRDGAATVHVGKFTADTDLLRSIAQATGCMIWVGVNNTWERI